MIICFLFFFFCKFPLEMNAFYIRTAKKKEKKIGQRMETIVPIIEKDQLPIGRMRGKIRAFSRKHEGFPQHFLEIPAKMCNHSNSNVQCWKKISNPSQRVQRKEKTSPDCSENITNRLFLIIDNFICD